MRLLNSFLVIVLASHLAECHLKTHFRDFYSPYRAVLPKSNGTQLSIVDSVLSPKLFKFMIGGLSKIIWDEMPKLLNQTDLKINSQCRASLVDTLDGLVVGKKWAFELLDSSSKKPYGIMDGTLTYFGDYDQCLDIETKTSTGNSTGRYCAINVMPLDTSSVPNIHKNFLHLTAIPLKGTGFYFGQCFPSNCSTDDVANIVVAALADGYPLELETLSCDTHEEISYSTRFSKMSKEQSWSTYGILTMIAIVSLFTGLDFALPKNGSKLVSIFSIKQNAVKTFYTKSNEPRATAVDSAKLFIMFFAVAGHASYCLDTPFGIYIIGHYQWHLEQIRDFIIQPVINETRVGLMNLFSGLVTFWVTEKVVSNGLQTFPKLILDRYLRHAPAMLALVAHEFIWPLLFGGPLYTRAGEYILEKCSNSWKSNLLLIHNWGTSGLSTCVSHTYYSAADFQLFILGLFVVFALKKFPSLGLTLCWVLIAVGNYLIASVTRDKSLSPVLISPNLSPKEMMRYFDNVHLQSYTYLPHYFSGILVAYLLSTGYKFDVTNSSNKKFWPIVCAGLYVFAEWSTSLINTFDVIPNSMFPAYALLSRNCYIISAVIGIIYMASVQPTISKKKVPSDKENEVKASDTHSTEDSSTPATSETPLEPALKFSMMKGLSQLTFSIYMINVWFLRTDFFVARQLLQNSPYPFIKRMIYSTYFIVALAFYFQMYFVAPANNVRKMLFKKAPSDKKKTQ